MAKNKTYFALKFEDCKACEMASFNYILTLKNRRNHEIAFGPIDFMTKERVFKLMIANKNPYFVCALEKKNGNFFSQETKLIVVENNRYRRKHYFYIQNFHLM